MVPILLLKISQELVTETGTWAIRLCLPPRTRPSAIITLDFLSKKMVQSNSYLSTTGLMRTQALGPVMNQFPFSSTHRPWIVLKNSLWLWIKRQLNNLCHKTYPLISQWSKIIIAVCPVNMTQVLWLLTQSGIYLSDVVCQLATMNLGLKLATLVRTVTQTLFRMLSQWAMTTSTSIHKV